MAGRSGRRAAHAELSRTHPHRPPYTPIAPVHTRDAGAYARTMADMPAHGERRADRTVVPAAPPRPLWQPGDRGVLRLPSGRLVRGRGLREPMPSGHPPTFGVYLLGARPPQFGWVSRWVRWPDFRLPTDRELAAQVLREALRRAAVERVEIACGGGRGRTGTALACLAVLDGVPADEAVAYVRERYDPHAVETPWQRRFVRTFPAEKGRR